MIRLRLATAALAVILGAHGAHAGDPQQEPGTKIRIEPKELAVPYSAPGKVNSPHTVPKPAEATLRVPAGFAVNVFADTVSSARNLLVLPNGDILLAQQSDGKVSLLRDDGHGKAKSVTVFADGFHQPFGLAAGKDFILIGDLEGVWRVPYTAGDTAARAKPTRITPEGALGEGGGHITRNVALSPDGSKIFVAIGSKSNLAEEPLPRATIQEFAADGSHQRTFASGLRNPVGLTFAPGTNDLYTVVNERDMVGSELVPDYLTKVTDGGFYGWPYAWLGPNPEAKMEGKRPDLVSKATAPDLLFRSHSAPIALAFSTGTQFPKEYQGGAFVALHGSWNAVPPRGYHAVYVPFSGGKPAGDYIVFATGFWSDGEDRANVWGRPSGVAIAKDGSLLIADDVSGTVWRVSYTGK